MTTADRFGGLRALLQKTPSEDVWQEIVDELAVWDEGERERVALPYVLDHLDRWPDAIRREVHREAPEWLWGLGNTLRWPSLEILERIAASEGARRVRCVEMVDVERAHAALVGRLVGLRTYTIELYGEDGGLGELMGARWPASLRTLKLGAIHGELRGDDSALAAAIAQNETLAGLEVLELEELKVREAGARALAGSPHMRGLRTLDLSYNEIGAAGVRALADSAHLAGLRHLSLMGEEPGAELAALVESPHMQGLRTLELSGASLVAEDLEALAGVACPPALESLVLDRVHMSGRVMEALAAAPVARVVRTLRTEARSDGGATARLLGSPHLSGLRELYLTSPGEEVLMALAQSEALGGLERLSVSDCVWSERVGEAMAQAAFVGSVRMLGLRAIEGDVVGLLERGAWGALSAVSLSQQGARVGDAGAIRLAACEALRGVERLDVSGAEIGDEGAAALAASPHLSALRGLSLHNNRIGDVGVAALVASAQLARLESLGLGKNQIGDAGAAALAGSPLMGESLGMLGKNRIGDAGLLALARSPHIRPQSRLELSDNPISDAGILALAADPALARLEGKINLEIAGVSEAAWRALLGSPYASESLRRAVELWLYRLRRPR